MSSQEVLEFKGKVDTAFLSATRTVTTALRVALSTSLTPWDTANIYLDQQFGPKEKEFNILNDIWNKKKKKGR